MPREGAGAAELDVKPAFAVGRPFAPGTAFGSCMFDSVEYKEMLLMIVFSKRRSHMTQVSPRSKDKRAEQSG